MANTYTKIYLHIVFAVKNRESMIPHYLQPRINSFIRSYLCGHGHHPYAVGGTDNHIHILIGYNINEKIPDLVRDLKIAVSRLINDEHLIPFKFSWQNGYGCFSYSHSHVDAVKNYILNQAEHHKSVSLREEFRGMLDNYHVEYDENYIFQDSE